MASMHRSLRTLACVGVSFRSSMAANYGGFTAKSPDHSEGANEKNRKTIWLPSADYGVHVYETFGENLTHGAALSWLRELLVKRRFSKPAGIAAPLPPCVTVVVRS